MKSYGGKHSKNYIYNYKASIVQNRISYDNPGVIALEEEFEVIKSNPFAMKEIIEEILRKKPCSP